MNTDKTEHSMTLSQLFENYLAFLWQTFTYDMDVFAQGWLYYWLLIPFFGYGMFFIMKWSFLLLPFYGPLVMVLKTFLIALQILKGNRCTRKDYSPDNPISDN